MLSKIKNSLTAKVFLLVFTALGVCCMLIYCILIAVLPKQYQFTQDKQLNTNAEIFISELKNLQYEDGIKAIYDFCIQNSSAVVLVNENQTLTFGEINFDEQSIATSSVAANICFLNSDSEYTIVISSVMHAADKILRLLLSLLPAVFLIIILLSVLSAFICSKIIVSPIAKISQISKRLAALDMTWRCDYKSQDEIGVLADNLNTMALNLQKSMQELTLANEQLAVDVKKLQSLDEQRGYFFAAASHELKTPLTILKGQIENMILGYGDYQNHEKYLPEALKAAEDIERLVKEIITISKMESMDLQDTLRDVSIKQTVNDIVQIILPLAQDKQIRIHQNIGCDKFISVNPNLWNKALSNIIGNAVRHSPCSENVFISLQTCENKAALVIENTGVSIPKDDLSEIFTPFFRVDKSRNKATGGSGLGLYIVKTILDLHGMTYCIKNTENGLAFFIYLN